MNKAREYAQELIKESYPEHDEESRVNRLLEYGKTATNELCFMYLPPHITIEQADIISLTMLNMLQEPEKYLKP